MSKRMDENKKKVVVDEIHRQARNKFVRRSVIQIGINDTIQIDLVEMIPYSTQNWGYKYLLTAIDIFSKKAYARPLKNKTGSEVVKAMSSIIQEIGTKPKNIHSDQGKEFFNKDFKKLMERHKINFYNTFTHLKASICERFNRTLKAKMWKMFSLNGNYKWVKELPELIKNYNNSFHRTIKMRPTEVTKEHEQHLLNSVYKNVITKPKNRFKVGDHVRITKYKGVFKKGYQPNWSTEIFIVVQVHATSPITYSIKDLTDTLILGTFYEPELQKVKYKDIYLVEKVVKKKGDKELVKWLGFDDSHNSWISKNDYV